MWSWARLRWILLAVLAAAVVAIYGLLILRSGDEETGSPISSIVTGARTTPTRATTQTTATAGTSAGSESSGIEAAPEGDGVTEATSGATETVPEAEPERVEPLPVKTLAIHMCGVQPETVATGGNSLIWVMVKGHATSVTAYLTGSAAMTFEIPYDYTDGNYEYWNYYFTVPTHSSDFNITVVATAADGFTAAASAGSLHVRAHPL